MHQKAGGRQPGGCYVVWAAWAAAERCVFCTAPQSQMSDFGPKTAFKIVDGIRDKARWGRQPEALSKRACWAGVNH